jgi:hypothetical protein
MGRMLVRSQPGLVQDRVQDSPFSHVLIHWVVGPHLHMPIRGTHLKDDRRKIENLS